MKRKKARPGDVYMVNGLVCMVTFVGEQASVIFDDGSTGKMPLHHLYEGVPHGSAGDYLQPLLAALKAIGTDEDPVPLYTDAEMQKAHRVGMIVGAMSACDDIYARVLQLQKDKIDTPAIVRTVEQYIAGIRHLAIKDGVAENPKPNIIPLNK